MLDGYSMFRPECNSSFDSFDAKFWVNLMAPALLFAVFFGTYGVSWLIGNVQPRVRMQRDQLTGMFFSLYSSFFTAITALAMGLFVCYKHPNGNSSLKSSPEVLCFDEAWHSKAYASVAAVVLYCLCVLVLFGYVIRRAPTLFTKSESFRQYFKFLFVKFHPDAYWFQLPVVCRSIFLGVASVAFQSGALQLYWIIIVQGLYMLAVVAVRPWRHPSGNALDIVSSFSVIAICGVSVFFAPSAAMCASADKETRFTIDVSDGLILVMSIASLVLGLILATALVYWYKFAPVSREQNLALIDGVLGAFGIFTKAPPDVHQELVAKLHVCDKALLEATARLVQTELLGQQSGPKRLITPAPIHERMRDGSGDHCYLKLPRAATNVLQAR